MQLLFASLGCLVLFIKTQYPLTSVLIISPQWHKFQSVMVFIP